MPHETRGPAQELAQVKGERDELRAICRRLHDALLACMQDTHQVLRTSHTWSSPTYIIAAGLRVPKPKTRADRDAELKHHQVELRWKTASAVLVDSAEIKGMREHAHRQRQLNRKTDKRLRAKYGVP